MSTSEPRLTRQPDGDLRPDPEPGTPICHWRCDGTGLDRLEPEPEDRLPVPCPVHRPEAAAARDRAAARAREAVARRARAVARPHSVRRRAALVD